MRNDEISGMDFALGATADAIRETTARFAADRMGAVLARLEKTAE